MNKRGNTFIKETIRVVDAIKSRRDSGENIPIWNTALKELSEMFPDDILTIDIVRWTYRRNAKGTQRESIQRAGELPLEERLLKKINGKQSIVALADLFKVEQKDIILAAVNLNLNGYSGVSMWKENDTTYIRNAKKKKLIGIEHDHTKMWEDLTEIEIGIIGDTHLASEYSAEEELADFYNLIKKRGIKTVYHVGDLTEGYKQSRHHTFLGNKAIGFSNQLDYVVKNYPKVDGVTTYVISGNHDLFFVEDGLANIVKTVSLVRPDIVYVGDEFARIWLTPKVDLTMYHPNDGSSGNVFTKLQSFVERAGDKLSKINIIGHYHKTGWIDFKDVYVMYPGSFQRQSNWMNIKNLRSELGALILKLKVNKSGELVSLVVEHINYNNYYSKNK